MRIATAAGAADRPNEDRARTDGRMVVVVDGLTATRWPRTKMSDDATVAYCTDLET